MIYIVLSYVSQIVYLAAQLGAGSVSAQLSYQPEIPECLTKE